MKSLIFLLAFFLLIFGSSLSAETILQGSTNDVFRTLSKKHIDKLLSFNINRVGKLNLVTLSKELDEVEWKTFDLGFLIGSGGNRTTSIYFVETKTVVLNTMSLSELQNKPVSLFSWTLHEGMGALGYQDENYELSSSIAFLAENTSLEDLNAAKEGLESNFTQDKIIRAKENRTYKMASGSGTVVGGGGNAIALELKKKLMQRLMAKTKNKKALKKLSLLAIEFTAMSGSYSNDEGPDFTFDDNDKVLLLDEIASGSLDIVFGAKYLDKLLTALNSYLF